MAAGPPKDDVNRLAAVQALAGSRSLRAVWGERAGGLTFEIAGVERCFVKWAPAASSIDLGAEAVRLSWAAPFTSAPRVLDCGTDESGRI